MNIETRLRKIEAVVNADQPNAADQEHLNWHLDVIAAVYENDDPDALESALMALGPRPAAKTESAQAFERVLEKAYGGKTE